jgi:hypothetical protein
MSPHSEVGNNDSEGREKTLRMARGLKPSHQALSQSGWLMRILGSIVLIFLLEVFDTRQQFGLRRTITPQLVRNEGTRDIAQGF